MNREIKFRGRLINGDKFEYGSLDITSSGLYYIRAHSIQAGGFGAYLASQIDPATVGQFTGLLDKNGVEIYEGDLIKWAFREPNNPIIDEYYTEPVEWDECGFFLDGGAPLSVAMDDCEVVGNLHQHPHLISSHE